MLCPLLLFSASRNCCVVAVTELQPADSFAWYAAGNFSFLVDVRTESEYVDYHIEGTVFVENLASASAVPDSLLGCK